MVRMEVPQYTSYKDGPQQTQHEKVELCIRINKLMIPRASAKSRPENGSSARVPAVTANVLSR